MESDWIVRGVLVVILFLIGVDTAPNEADGLSKLKFTKVEMCDSKVDYPATTTVEITDKDGKQFFSGSTVFDTDFGENSDYNVTIFMKNNREDPKFAQLVSFYEEDFCAALKKYLGSMLEDIEKAVGIAPGECPIPKGTYTLKDYALDLDSMGDRFAAVPEGVLQVVQVVSDKKTRNVLYCTVTEIDNLPD